jgi:hypothetical protein
MKEMECQWYRQVLEWTGELTDAHISTLKYAPYVFFSGVKSVESKIDLASQCVIMTIDIKKDKLDKDRLRMMLASFRFLFGDKWTFNVIAGKRNGRKSNKTRRTANGKRKGRTSGPRKVSNARVKPQNGG